MKTYQYLLLTILQNIWEVIDLLDMHNIYSSTGTVPQKNHFEIESNLNHRTPSPWDRRSIPSPCGRPGGPWTAPGRPCGPPPAAARGRTAGCPAGPGPPHPGTPGQSYRKIFGLIICENIMDTERLGTGCRGEGVGRGHGESNDQCWTCQYP